MEILQLKPPCRQRDGELLITCDTVDTALSELRTYQLQLTADLAGLGTGEHGRYLTALRWPVGLVCAYG